MHRNNKIFVASFIEYRCLDYFKKIVTVVHYPGRGDILKSI